MFENTPLMIDNVLYLSTPYNKVVALDAETGAALWTYDPKAYEDGQPAERDRLRSPGCGSMARRRQAPDFMNSRYRLICLDAKTGQPVRRSATTASSIPSHGLIWPINKLHYTQTSRRWFTKIW